MGGRTAGAAAAGRTGAGAAAAGGGALMLDSGGAEERGTGVTWVELTAGAEGGAGVLSARCEKLRPQHVSSSLYNHHG